MSTEFERDLEELKCVKRDEKNINNNIGLDIELANTEEHLVGWAQEYCLLLTKIAEAKKLVKNLELQKLIYEKYLLGSFKIKK